MGQKVNPLVFRQTIYNSQVSGWYTKKDGYSNLMLRDFYIKKFLVFLLKSHGIFLRSSKIEYTDQFVFLDLDLFFSYVLTNRSKTFWAKVFFKSVKKKYISIQRIKNLKIFLLKLQSSLVDMKMPGREVPVKLNTDLFLDYKERFLFFLSMREKRKFLLRKTKISLLSVVKRSFIPKVLRVKFSKLNKLFRLKKLNLSYRPYVLDYVFCKNNFLSSFDLLELNKSVCKSLQKFMGIEKVYIRFTCSQLFFLPSLKLYLKFFFKELFFFKKSKHLSLFFYEALEILYFVLCTFSSGNAKLLASFLKVLFENSRSHIYIVRFLKKILGVFFSKIPQELLVVSGIKILIKGRFNKRRRTKTLILQQGQISLQTISIPVDYFYTQAVTLYGSFGIKVWLSKKVIKFLWGNNSVG